ncbi:hypothetical protein [Paenisporosarcina sp. OV554]|nr:hypothetical protein [Paenisporosarcina sp. OV554]PUB17817.1 hypothetical protein C8K15_10111 [Paenisporosarcina sp. OV554]
MTYYLAVTLGMLMCLGILFGTFVYSLTLALNTKDATKVDPIK